MLKPTHKIPCFLLRQFFEFYHPIVCDDDIHSDVLLSKWHCVFFLVSTPIGIRNMATQSAATSTTTSTPQVDTKIPDEKKAPVITSIGPKMFEARLASCELMYNRLFGGRNPFALCAMITPLVAESMKQEWRDSVYDHMSRFITRSNKRKEKHTIAWGIQDVLNRLYQDPKWINANEIVRLWNRKGSAAETAAATPSLQQCLLKAQRLLPFFNASE